VFEDPSAQIEALAPQRRRPVDTWRLIAFVVFTVVLGLAIALASAIQAWSYWANVGSGSAQAPTTDLNPPTNVSASAPLSSNIVSVGWTGASLTTGQPATGYVVVRIRNSDGSTFAACGSTMVSPIAGTSCSDVGVVDGVYHYGVTALFGSWTAVGAPSGSVTVVNASTPPVVTVTSISPAPNGNGFNKVSPVVVILSATPGSLGTPILSVTYTLDSASPVVTVGNSATISVSGDGAHTVSYSAIDTSSRVSTTGVLIVRIDTVAPASPSSPVLVAASDSGLSSTDGVTNVTAPTFTGTAEVGSTVTIRNGATVLGSGVATGGTYTITSSVLTAGVKSITATATDLAANVGATSAATSITIDTTAPAAPGAPALAAGSDTGRSATDKITKLATPTLVGTTTAATTVTLFDGATSVGSITTATTSYSITTSTLTDGNRTITAKATDLAGNTSVASTAYVFTLDTIAPAAPSAPILAAASDSGTSTTDGITNKTTPTVTGSNESAAIVTLFDAATSVGTVTTTATTYSIVSSLLAEGTHLLSATSTDIAGNTGVASGSTTVVIDTVLPAAPSAPILIAASDTGVSSTDNITKATVFTMTGTAEAGVSVILRNGTTNTGSAVTAVGGVYSATTGTLTAGARTMTARATDVAGNVGAISAATVVTIDTTAPTVTINKKTGQADPTTATPINFTAVFTESVFGMTNGSVVLTGTAGATTIVVTGSGTTYNVAVSGMTKTGTVIASLPVGAAQDTAGNSSAASTATDNNVAYIDSTAPVISISSFTAGAGQTATITGVAGITPGDSSTVTIVLCKVNVFPCTAGNTLATLTATANGVGAWTTTSASLGTQPVLYARVSQSDATGNTGVSVVAGPVAIS
jgi:Bacterial Ig-like domain